MADQNIVISIDAELGSGLTRALDILEKLGTVSKKDADAFRELNAAAQQTATGQASVQKEVAKTDASLTNISKTIDKVNSKPIEVVKRDQVGIIENLKNRINQLTEARDKANDPAKITRYNALLQNQNQRLRELQGTAVSTTRGVGVLDSAISGIGAAIAGAFAVQAVINFAAESVRAFQEAERNALILKNAVGVNGGLQSDFEDLIRQSKELQSATIFSDDSIQRAQTAALQFGLTKEQVEALIPVVADFASATGQDLQTALDGVLQGVNGMGRGLKIYGVTIDETQTATERLGDITGQLTKKFEDSAKAVGETSFGANEKYKNQLDDIQEKLGERLAPVLQQTRGFFLQVGDSAVGLAEDLFNLGENIADFVSGPISKLPELIAKAGQANKESIANATEAFKGLSNTEIAAKVDVLTAALKTAQDEAKGLDAEQAQSANNRIIEYATQITALNNITAARKAGLGVLSDEEKALEKLKNAAALSNAELLAIKKTLEGKNDINLRDEIKLIDDLIEKRKKAGEKELQDREKNKAALEALEQKASDRLLAIKAAEVDKVAELEQLKQKELRDLVSAAGAASGADVEPILLEFESTGVADIEKTIKLLQDAKFSTDEIDKFTSAVLKTNKAFNDLIEKEKLAQAEINIKINIEKVNTEFEEFKNELEDLQTSKEIEIRTKFVQDGDFSNEAFAKMQKQIEALSEKTFEKLIAQAKAYGVDKAVIDDLILDHQNTVSKSGLDVAKEEHESKLELLEKEKQEREALANGIVDAFKQAISLIGEATSNYYDEKISLIDDDLEHTLESFDKQLEENEQLHSDRKRGDRQYESSKRQLEAQRADAEAKADKERRKLIREQAIINRDLAIANAIINTAVGATAQFQAGPIIGAVLAALIIALGAAEIAVIASTPIPSFAKGVEKVTGKGTETSDDVPAKLSVGERVVTAEKNRKYFPILHAIHEGMFAPEVLNKIAKMSPETLKEISKIDTKYLKEISRIDSKTLKEITHLDSKTLKQITSSRESIHTKENKSESIFSKISSDTLRVLAKSNPDLIREIAMIPDFALKQLSIPSFQLKVPDMNFRLKPPEREKPEQKAPEVKYVGPTEAEMLYAAKHGETILKNEASLAAKIGKSVAENLTNPYDKYRK